MFLEIPDGWISDFIGQNPVGSRRDCSEDGAACFRIGHGTMQGIRFCETVPVECLGGIPSSIRIKFFRHGLNVAADRCRRLAERVFFIELSEIITGKDLQHATCSHKEGNPPKQTIDFDEQMNTNTALDLDENFYGDQDFDMEDFDPEGFDMEGGSNPYDEDKY